VCRANRCEPRGLGLGFCLGRFPFNAGQCLSPVAIVLQTGYNLDLMSSLRVLLSASQIDHRIQELAREIERDYPEGPVYLIGILKGAYIFLSDLARAVKTPTRIEFLGISSY